MTSTDVAVRESSPESETQRRAPAGSWSLTPLLRRLHFYVGILVGPFLVVAALTGLGYALTPQLDGLAYGDHFRVSEIGTGLAPLADQVEAARTAVPEGTVSTVVPPSAPDAATQVVLAIDGSDDTPRTVLVDPYTGTVQAVLPWSGDSPITTWFRDMHGNLHLGEAGGLYIELAASWLWVLALVGLVLWWRRQRGTQRLRSILLPGRSANAGARRTRTWHAGTGVWLLAALLVLTTTGLTWSTYAGERFDLVQEQLNAESISVDTTLARTAQGELSDDPTVAASGFDVVLTAARHHGLDGPVEITPGAGRAWTVAQSDNDWPVHRDVVAVDPASGTITDEVAWADQPLFAQLTVLGIYAHMGVLFGPLNQIALALTALGLVAVIFWGYRMWWQRRPTRADRRRPLGKPPARGTLRRLPFVWVVAIAVGAAVIGWTLPLLGGSLLAFLAIDVAAGAISRRRTPSAVAGRRT